MPTVTISVSYGVEGKIQDVENLEALINTNIPSDMEIK